LVTIGRPSLRIACQRPGQGLSAPGHQTSAPTLEWHQAGPPFGNRPGQEQRFTRGSPAIAPALPDRAIRDGRHADRSNAARSTPRGSCDPVLGDPVCFCVHIAPRSVRIGITSRRLRHDGIIGPLFSRCLARNRRHVSVGHARAHRRLGGPIGAPGRLRANRACTKADGTCRARSGLQFATGFSASAVIGFFDFWHSIGTVRRQRRKTRLPGRPPCLPARPAARRD